MTDVVVGVADVVVVDDDDDDEAKNSVMGATVSWTGCPVMSPPAGRRHGVMDDTIKEELAMRSNKTGWEINAPFTNCATMAPILPDAAQMPIPVDRTMVGNNSLVMQSMVFHAAIEKH